MTTGYDKNIKFSLDFEHWLGSLPQQQNNTLSYFLKITRLRLYFRGIKFMQNTIKKELTYSSFDTLYSPFFTLDYSRRKQQ